MLLTAEVEQVTLPASFYHILSLTCFHTHIFKRQDDGGHDAGDEEDDSQHGEQSGAGGEVHLSGNQNQKAIFLIVSRKTQLS